MVAGPICLANGGMSFVCTRGIPVVSSLAAAISNVGLDATDHPLDCEHYSHIRAMALARTWSSVGVASWLGDGGGIRMLGNRCRNDRFASEPTIRTPMLNGVGSVKVSAPKIIIVSGSLMPSSYTASVQLTRGATL